MPPPGLRLMCSPLEVSPATALLPKPVPTFSPFRGKHLLQKKITDKPYLFFNLVRDCPPDMAKNPKY